MFLHYEDVMVGEVWIAAESNRSLVAQRKRRQHRTRAGASLRSLYNVPEARPASM